MCLDTASQVLYLLGHYLDPSTRTQLQAGAEPRPLPVGTPISGGMAHIHTHIHCCWPQGDFYSYTVETRHWQLLSSDTHRDGGPHLIYDHQMTFDSTSKIIYVFGGRILTSYVWF